jgi:hypothetical protein
MSDHGRASKLGWGVMLALAITLLFSGPAFSQMGCDHPGDMPYGLIGFCAGMPASASDMNANFELVAGAIVRKLGPLTGADVSNTTGAIQIRRGALSDGTIVAADLDPSIAGAGLRLTGTALEVDPVWLTAAVRSRITLSPTLFTVVHLGAETLPYIPDLQRDTGISIANSACFLVEVQASDDAGQNDTTRCWIESAGPAASMTWRVHGWSNGSSGSFVCSARCITW